MKWMISLAMVLVLAASGQAVVLHDDMMPEDRPPDGLVGRWGGSGSCVVIGPEWAIASQHQGGGVGTAVTIAGEAYVVSEVYDSSYDLRLVRLKKSDGSAAKLEDFADLSYETTSLLNREVALGGFGKGRGEELLAYGIVYGYLWQGSSNSVQRWGSNIIEAVYGNILVVDFDNLGDADATPCEASLAAWDSGGGWFVKNELTGCWEVVGLSVSTERSGESRFRSKTNPLVETKDRSFALAIAMCADWITGITGTLTHAPLPEEPATVTLVVIGGTGGGSYEAGTEISIAADVPDGCQFIEWSGDVATVRDTFSAQTTVVVNQNMTVTAVVGPDNALEVTASLDWSWTYQNAPRTTKGRHGVVLTIAVADDGEQNGPYEVAVTQSGDGDQVLLVPTDDPLVWIVLGGQVDEAAPGSVTLTVAVNGSDGECCGETACSLTVRPLGDVDGNNGVEGTDMTIMIQALNGLSGAGYDVRVFDLDGNGGVEPTDLSIMTNLMNGMPVL